MLIIKNIFEFLLENQNKNKKLVINLIKKEKLTTHNLILNSIKNSILENEIVKNYYSLSPEIKAEIIKNDKVEGDKIETIEKEIYNKEYNYIKKEMHKVIKEKNSLKNDKNKEFENLHVIITPGHGGRRSHEPGAQHFKTDEKNLNEDIAFEVIKNLLNKNVNVYLCTPLTGRVKKEKLPLNNPHLNILFSYYGPPAINGFYNEKDKKYKKRPVDGHYMFSQATAEIVKNLKPNAKIICLDFHHDSCGQRDYCGEIVNGKENSCSIYGYKPFHRIENEDEKENEKIIKKMPSKYSQFIENSKKLGEILVKNCRNVYKLEGKEFSEKSGVFGKEFLITSFGKGNIHASLLVENGYMCNKNQLDKILNTKLMKKLAEKTANSIVEYYKNIENV